MRKRPSLCVLADPIAERGLDCVRAGTVDDSRRAGPAKGAPEGPRFRNDLWSAEPGKRLAGVVHAVLLHVAENALAVLLFILLDMLQGLTDLGTCRLEDSRVVGAGYVLFGHQHIVKHGSLVGGGAGRDACQLFAGLGPTRALHCLAAFHVLLRSAHRVLGSALFVARGLLGDGHLTAKACPARHESSALLATGLHPAGSSSLAAGLHAFLGAALTAGLHASLGSALAARLLASLSEEPAYSVVVLQFLLSELIEHPPEFGVFCLLGVTAVLFDTHLLMAQLVLEKTSFLLREM